MCAALLAITAAMPTRAWAAGTNPNEVVDTNATANSLAQSLVGTGVSVSNVVFTGSAAAKGAFAFTDASVAGMSQGVILSSGNAADVVGPNTSDSWSTDWAGPGDGDLTALSGFPTQDAAVLEFDFVPVATQVSFQYAFASDEYSEWVNTAFNDVFAFFVDGQNCAEVRQVAGDATSPFVPVAVNNINDSNPIQVPPPPAMRPDLFRDNSYNGGVPTAIDLESDGITSVLTCQAPVTPNVTNHMKLAIADASDGVYDSNVFIAAGSLVSNDNPTADLGVTPRAGAAPLAVIATIEAHDPHHLPLTYSLDWGDGTVASGVPLPDLTATATHTFQYGGTYIVKLVVSNGTLSGHDQQDVDVSGSPPPNIATKTTAKSATNPSVFGQSVSLTATVKRVAPATGAVTTGNVEFRDNGTPIGTSAVVNGVAKLATKTLAVGAHSIIAAYGGSATDAASTSAPMTQTVGLAPTSTTVTTNVNPSVNGQAVNVRATVKRVSPSSGPASGTVDFYDGVALIASGVTLNANGVAVTKVRFGVGLHGLHADFSGSANELSSHGTVTQTVNPGNTTTTLTVSPLSTLPGRTVTVSIVVRPVSPSTGVPDGTVIIYDNAQPAFSQALTAGKLVIKTTSFATGTHLLTALYGGSGSFNGSQSVIVTLTIT